MEVVFFLIEFRPTVWIAIIICLLTSSFSLCTGVLVTEAGGVLRPEPGVSECHVAGGGGVSGDGPTPAPQDGTVPGPRSLLAPPGEGQAGQELQDETQEQMKENAGIRNVINSKEFGILVIGKHNYNLNYIFIF